MVLTLTISIITFLLISISAFALPRIKFKKIKFDTYWVVAIIGALALLITGLSPLNDIIESFSFDKSMNPIKILILFFSMTLLSIYLDELGLFKFLAIKASKICKSSQYGLFIIFYFLTAVLTMFTSNDVVILTLTPFLIFFAKHSDIDPMPYIIAEFVAANTWSMMFIIGNPTNIYLATSSEIEFLQYFKIMSIPTIIAGVIELAILFLLFKKKLSIKMKNCEIKNEKLHSKTHVIIGLIHLLTCLILLIISSYVKFEMYLISLGCAISVLTISCITRLVRKEKFTPISHTLNRLPYALIPFFLSMYVIVAAFISQGISTSFADFLNKGNPIFSYGYSSFVVSNIMNNIPMSIFYETLVNTLTGISKTQAIYASIVGSNLGAILSPLGALAGIMFSSLVRKKGVRFTFLDFFKYGVIISIPTITATLLSLFCIIK